MELEILENYFYFSGLFDDLKTEMCDKISHCDKRIEVDGVTYVPIPDVHTVINGDNHEKDTSKS